MPAFPVFAKEWQAPVVTALPQPASSTLAHQAAAIAVKNAFLAPTAFPWVLRGCADGGGGFSTSTDLLTDTSDIVAATSGNHTWFWLSQPATGQQFVVDFNQADRTSITFAVSFGAGFTGGSATARPTATDESVVVRTWFTGSTNGRFSLLLNHSTDGTVTYCWIVSEGIICAILTLGLAIPGHGSWSPSLIGDMGGPGSISETSTFNNLSTFFGNSRVLAMAAAGSMLLRWTFAVSEAADLAARYAGRPSKSGNWQHWPIGLACITAPRIGRHGRLADLFRLPSDVPHGWIFRNPDGGEQALMTIGRCLAIPWQHDMPPAVF